MQATLDRLRERREERGDEGGFTLIELLIVIVILGILAAIVVFAVQNLTSQSSTAGCQSDYKTVETAAEAYKAQIGHYPTAADASQIPTSGPGTGEAPAASDVGWLQLYLVQPGTTTTVGPWLRDLPSSAHYTMALNGESIPVGTWVSVNGGAAAKTTAAGTNDGAIYIQPTGTNSATNPAATGNSAAAACAGVK